MFPCIELLETVYFILFSEFQIHLFNLVITIFCPHSIFFIQHFGRTIFRADMFTCLVLMTKCLKPSMTEELTCLN